MFCQNTVLSFFLKSWAKFHITLISTKEETNITDMAKVRPAGRMRPAKDFLRPLKQIYLGIIMFLDIILQVNM